MYSLLRSSIVCSIFCSPIYNCLNRKYWKRLRYRINIARYTELLSPIAATRDDDVVVDVYFCCQLVCGKHSMNCFQLSITEELKIRLYLVQNQLNVFDIAYKTIPIVVIGMVEFLFLMVTVHIDR